MGSATGNRHVGSSLERLQARAHRQRSARLRAAAAGPRRRSLRLSCVLPCWNEAANLEPLLSALSDTVRTLASEWEIVVVDDGSTDGSLDTLARGGWLDRPGIRVLQLSRNFGKEAALSAGLQAARGDAVVLMDADLQHPPHLLAQMVRHWRNGADVVYAVREHRRDESTFKRWGARTFYRLIKPAGRFEVPEDAGDFRLMDRRVVDALLALPERNRFMKGLYAWVGFDAVALPYQPAQRLHGRSSFAPWRLIRLSIDGLTAFTTWPLRAASLAGMLLATLGFCYGAYVTLRHLLYGSEVSGWTTIVTCLLLFSGVQLISLGILGEYVGRIFEEVKARPLYVVKADVGHGLRARPS